MIAWLTHPVIMVGLGGAIGSNARYWLGRSIRELTEPSTFPWGTMLINISGSIILGIVASLVKDRSTAWFLLLGTGFCGGYTTFSTFSLEIIEAIQQGRWLPVCMYVLSSVVGGAIGLGLMALLLQPAE